MGLRSARVTDSDDVLAGSTPIRDVPGIGPARALACRGIGIRTLAQALHYAPRNVETTPDLSTTGPLPAGVPVRVRVRLLRLRPSFGRGRRGGLDTWWERADGRSVRARFFQAGYLRRHLVPGEWYLLEGRSDASQADILLHPGFHHLPQAEAEPVSAPGLCQVQYRLPEGLGERTWLSIIEQALPVADLLGDPSGRVDAIHYGNFLRELHRPSSESAWTHARRALAEREWEALAWRVRQQRQFLLRSGGRAWRWNDDIDARARARLPFSLTAGQEVALAAIRGDVQAATPMYRLVHGDVGSGKTALALLAALAVIADGGQVLLLAPTTILAKQHFHFISACLRDSRVQVGFLTGASSVSERTTLETDLRAGTLHFLIGTHALLDPRYQPKNCGLVIIDEQHRFGVEQRATLAQRRGPEQNWQADLLLLTATPIPRTLALVAFGDLDVIGIRGRPPGRGTVTTEVWRWRSNAELRKIIGPRGDGRTFIVCPRRVEGEDGTVADATAINQDLAAHWPDRVGLLHGGLTEDEKNAAIERFTVGTVDCLVATSVIEVGIDIPAADLLIVLDAERFGLASLHQLRGRIGRGERPGRCLLLHRSEEADPRLTLLTSTDDGLTIAQADLDQRGPGELLGTAQHGLPAFRIADLRHDLDLLPPAHARVAAAIAAGITTMPAGFALFAADANPGAVLGHPQPCQPGGPAQDPLPYG